MSGARLHAIARALGSPALAFALLTVPLVLVPTGLVGLRLALAVAYGGGAEAFDRHYEAQAAERVGRAADSADGFQRLVESWNPESNWQRTLLYADRAPEDLCKAEFGEIEDGRMMFAIICLGIEPRAPEDGPPLEHRDLAADARDRALWLTARALRMSAAWLADLPVIVVHQQQQLAPGDVAVYTTSYEQVGRSHTLEARLAVLEDQLSEFENTARGRRRPISLR